MVAPSGVRRVQGHVEGPALGVHLLSPFAGREIAGGQIDGPRRHDTGESKCCQRPECRQQARPGVELPGWAISKGHEDGRYTTPDSRSPAISCSG